MKTIEKQLVLANSLLVAIVILLMVVAIFQVLNYFNSKNCCGYANEISDEMVISSKNNDSQETEITHKQRIDTCYTIKVSDENIAKIDSRIESLKKELIQIKAKVDSLEKNCGKEQSSNTLDNEEIFSDTDVDSIPVEINETTEFIQKDDSIHAVVEEYRKKDTITHFDVSFAKSLYYYHRYPDYSEINRKIEQAKKSISLETKDFLNWETILGGSLVATGFSVPDKKKTFVQQIDVNTRGVTSTTEIEHVSYKTNPLKPVLIAVGGAFVLDGLLGNQIRKNLKSNKILDSIELEIYPTGLGFKINH